MSRVDREGWAYASGLCVARETGFFPLRMREELALLPPEELALRISRGWFGPAEPLKEFPRLAEERRKREFAEIRSVSPAGWPLDMVEMRFFADAVRASIVRYPLDGTGEGLAPFLAERAREAGAGPLAEALSRPVPGLLFSPRLAASLITDGAELSAVSAVAEESRDPLLLRWAVESVRMGAARVLVRALRLGAPREALSLFLGRIPAVPGMEDLVGKPSESAVLNFYPDGVTPGEEDRYLLRMAEESHGDPFGPARVLSYLLLYLFQERMLRRAVRDALGGRRRAAA